MDWHRTLHSADLQTLPDGYRITLAGDGFLYKMARLLIGAAVLTSQGRLTMHALAALLDQAPGLPRGKSPHCVPADGLIPPAGALSNHLTHGVDAFGGGTNSSTAWKSTRSRSGS